MNTCISSPLSSGNKLYPFMLMAFLFLSPGLSHSQIRLLEEEKSPEAIFDFDLGDSEVEFFLLGSWEALVAGVAGFMIKPDEPGLIELDYFPELELGFLFEQVPDLTLSVWLMKKYFFEFSVVGSLEENYILMGYQGDEEDILRHLYIGNRDIGIEPYPFITVPEMGDSSLGAEAELASDISTHRILLRYDNNDRGSKLFIGRNEVDETTLSLDSYIEGRYFRLPDSGITNLTLYLQDPSGSLLGSDGKKYRSATSEDAVLDSENGLVTLPDAEGWPGRLLVYYTKGGNPIGSTLLGEDALAVIDDEGKINPDLSPDDFNWNTVIPYDPEDLAKTMGERRRVTVGGRQCLLLWEPGVFSPFESLGSYVLPAGVPSELWRTRITIVTKGTREAQPDQAVSFSVHPEEARFEARVSGNIRSDLRNLYPFLQEPFVTPPDNSLYGPNRERTSGRFNSELLVQVLYPISDYFVETDLIPGSVRVTRNGKEETRFSVDYDSGMLSFHTQISPTDRIEVTYEKKVALLNNGDLLFVWGNSFDLSQSTNLDLAAGLRWNFLPGSYSESAYSRTGAIVASTGLKGELDHLSFDVSLGFSYTHPDTTGILRLFGMDQAGIELSLAEDIVYPSALPADPSAIGGFAATQNNRGRLLYKDYRKYGTLGSGVLQGPGWSVPAEQIFAYQSGSRPGPYNVAGSSAAGEAQSLVLDFELEDQEWTGIQIPVVPDQGPVDLSALKAFLMSYRTIDFSGLGEFDVYLQLGDLGEDLDGDTILDAENTPASDGFLFNDTAQGANLLVGGGPKGAGNNRLDTEDIDGNGFLDDEVPELVLTTSVVTGIDRDATWEVYKEYFSQFDPSDGNYRQRLARTRALRLILINSSGSACSGRFLIDKISLAGTSFGVNQNDRETDDLRVREIPEIAAQEPPDTDLDSAFPEVEEIFHPSGELQKVLEIDWDDYTGNTDKWTVRGFSPQTEGIRYKELVCYMRTPVLTPRGSGDSPQLIFSLLDHEDRGISWSLDPAVDCKWKKVRIRMDEKKAYSGNRFLDADVSVDDSYGSLSKFEVSMRGYSDGTIYLDELHLKEPDGALGAGLEAQTKMSWPGTLLFLGDTPFISDLTIEEKLHIITPGFAPLYGRPATAWDSYSRSEIGLGLFFIQLDLDMEILGNDDDFLLSGGHRMGLPRGETPLFLTDFHHLKANTESPDFDRGNSIDIFLGETGLIGIKSETFSRETMLRQVWSGTLSIPPEGWSDLGLNAAFSKTSLNYVHREADYFPSWILGYRFLAPRNEGGDLERAAETDLNVGLLPDPVGFKLATGLSYHSSGIAYSVRDQSHSLSYELHLPFALKDESEFSFSLGYCREWQGTTIEAEPGTIMKDFGTLLNRITTQPYLIDQVPIWEFYSEESELEFKRHSFTLRKALYQPSFVSSLSRQNLSHWSSLLFPSRFDFSFGKSFQKVVDLYDFLNNYEFHYRTNAVNLFGDLGRYPLFNFYTVDEYSAGLSVKLSYNTIGEMQSAVYTIDHLLAFEGERSNIFVLENYLNITEKDYTDLANISTISFDWFVYPQDGVRLPLIDHDVTRKGYIFSRESISLELHNLPVWVEVHPATLMISHETALRFPEHGFIRAELALGLDVESYPVAYDVREKIYRFVFVGLIEGRIEY